MAMFFYQAKQGPQKLVEGTLEAETIDAAVAQIVRLGYAPVDVRQVQEKRAVKRGRTLAWSFQRRIPYAETVFFVRQLSDLIGAGIPVLRALTLIGQQARHPRLKIVVARMNDYVRDGGTLSEAMSRCPEAFPRLYSNLVRAGETSGRLAEVLSRLADLAQRDLDTRSQLVSSLIYPSLILVVGSATIFALLTWVVPRLTGIFADLNESLPLPTVILLAVSGFLSRFWWLLALGIIAAGIYLRKVTENPGGRLWLDEKKMRLPVVGALIRSTETGRFARTMATLLGNGVIIVQALESVAGVMSNELMRQEVAKLAEAVRNGSSLNSAMRKSPVFPETVVSMISVGEESGQVHHGLERMADYFERQSQRYMKAITTLMEPLLILALGLVVGFVVLAMLMPLLRMNMIIH